MLPFDDERESEDRRFVFSLDLLRSFVGSGVANVGGGGSAPMFADPLTSIFRNFILCMSYCLGMCRNINSHVRCEM